MPVALLRRPADSFVRCVARHEPSPPLDPLLARRQHDGYARRLQEGGFDLAYVQADEAHPDGVFIEDTAVVLGRCALITRPGHPSRRGEVGPVARALETRGLTVTLMAAPATLDGGDVLRVGEKLFVGQSERTNDAGRAALADFARPLGWTVASVPLHGVLHLKSAAGALDEGSVLLFSGAVAAEAFSGLRVVEVGGADPEAANLVRLPDGRLLVAAHLPQSAAAVAAAGFTPVACDASEFARADGGLTCLSLRLRGLGPPVRNVT